MKLHSSRKHLSLRNEATRLLGGLNEVKHMEVVNDGKWHLATAPELLSLIHI